ncbi:MULTISPECIES: hypothetical protein [Acinetobacter]|uniref:Lipoprotein n=1 Tax=Acinetobacter stercoris TaxID=2126983 RepID=A0A2U3MXX8_9GAMM|nr:MULTISPECIES: hypothetical protein [Acinetobacter]MBI1450753.1 hypothetical protein [Acinetobacter sp. FL51]RZG71038.1 hypothetical protein EXU29_15860 [Acinetobacter wuhouensis]SPL70292.1 hypothetical protein KPC_1470 [Acinetobacter stercoris]
MTTKLKSLSICILLIGLGACSSKDHPKNDSAVEGQTAASSEALQNDIAASTVIVPKAQISPDQSLRELQLSDILAYHQIRYPTKWEIEGVGESTFNGNYDLIHPQLNLAPNQIFVIGNQNHDPQDNYLFIDMTNDEYFKYSNNMAINNIRYMKAPHIEPKQEFEKTQDYEARVQQEKQNAESKVTDYDLKLLEQVLNRSVRDIYLSHSNASYEYDADHEQMTVRYGQDIRSVVFMESEVIFKVQPELAKQIAEHFIQLRLGYVFNFKNNQLSLNGVFFYFNQPGNHDRRRNNIVDVMYVSPVFKPLSFKQRSAVELARQSVDDAFKQLKTMPFQDVSHAPVWNFKFGLDNYLSPETLLQKYPKPVIPEEPEELDYIPVEE